MRKAAIVTGILLFAAAASISQAQSYDSFTKGQIKNPPLVNALAALNKSALSPALCPNADSLSTNLTTDNGQNGIAFEITAANALRLCQISMAGSGTGVSLQLWVHPDGLPASSSAFNDGKWVLIDSVTGFTMTGSGYTVLPFNMSAIGMLSAQQKLGIAVFSPSNTGVGYRSGVAPYLFSDANLTINTQGWGLYGTSSANWTAPYSPRQFCGQLWYTAAPAGPTLVLIPVPSPTYNRRPVFAWHRVAGAASYTLQVAANSSYTSPIIAMPLLDTAYQPLIDLPVGQIYWRVKADNTTYSSSSFEILDNRVPILIPYVPKMTLERRPTLRWHPVQGAASYTISISTSQAPGASSEDFETGNLTAIPWTLSGSANWYVQAADKYQGTYAARSGSILASQSSSMSVQLNCVAGSISFYRKVSSESTYDKLSFYIDGVLQNNWSGEIVWSSVSYSVSAGVHTFLWTYSKDGSGTSGSDAAWIDLITFPSPGSTVFLTSPVSDTVFPVSSNLPYGFVSWKVQSNLVATYSSPDEFQVVPDSVPLLARFNGATLATQKPLFSWHSVPGTTFYTFSLSTTKNFSTPVLMMPHPDTFYLPLINLAEGTYYWRVSSDRNGVYASPDSFKISLTAIGNQEPMAQTLDKSFRVLVDKNRIMMRWNVAGGQKPVFMLFDLKGHLVFKTQLDCSRGIAAIPVSGKISKGACIAVLAAGQKKYSALVILP